MHYMEIESAASFRRAVCGFLGAFLCLSLFLPHERAQAADPLSGLTERPSNTQCLAGPRPVSANDVRLVPVFSQLTAYKPFYLQQSPADPATWYFSTRDGKIYSFVAPNSQPRLVLNVSDRIGILSSSNAYSKGGSEQWGIASFALHPNFAQNGYIFIQINGRKATEKYVLSSVMRYTLASTPQGFGEVFDKSSARMIIYQRQTNDTVLHHFGQITFGDGGLLYIGSGDGTENGPANRPLIPAQDCTELRGKILRINVNSNPSDAPYTIPPSNPYATSKTCRPEIYATGFRNPWRFSIDRTTGNIWLGDVGASTWEEVDEVEKGKNYGWPIYEGKECLGTTSECARKDLVAPVLASAHAGQSAAVIGGYVYRGKAMPWLRGDYIFSIFPRADLLALSKQSDGTYARRTLLAGVPVFSSYFTDKDGEIYGITGHSQTPQIQKLAPDTSGDPTVSIPPTLTASGCFDRVTGVTRPRITSGAIPYEVISPLWSDGAAKERWVALPNGGKITIGDDGDFTFPVGTVLIKEFAFQGRPIETRLLKRHTDGVWKGYTYAWRGDLSNADLVPEEGRTRKVANTATSTIQWHYPSRSQCFECHTTAAGIALGPEVLQLNNVISTPYPATKRRGNQLSTWAAIGLFNGPLPAPVASLASLVDPKDVRHSDVLRARSYLHANCAGCHRPDGPTGKAIDLRFSTTTQDMNVCNGDQEAGDVTFPGASILTPKDPSKSAISLRIHADGVGQMPPLGRTLVDATATALIDSWIKRPDVCNNFGDSDGDGIPNNIDNCRNVVNPTQADSDRDKFGDRCDGDWNGNLVADLNDRADLVSRVGATFLASPRWLNKYDFNGDGVIDQTDVKIFDNRMINKRPGPSALRQ